MATYNTYTEDEESFLRNNAPLMSRRELTEKFNLEFGANRSVAGIKAWCNARGYNSSSDGKFRRGHISWQTGLRGDDFKSHYTEESFKRMVERAVQGNRTHKIGDEVIIDGAPWIITSLEEGIPFHDRRQPKRRVVWERLHGDVPKNHCIICLDGNQMNCDPSNLCCIPTRYRTLLAKNKWWYKNADMIKTAIKWCELHYAIKEVENNG